MKRKDLIFVCICSLLLAPILIAGDYKKDIPRETAMKAFCGTWYNDSSIGIQKDIYNTNGTYEFYYDKSGTKPDWTGTFKIEKAWEDSEGNILFTVWRSFQGNSWVLSKISNSGTVLELNRYFKPDNPPSKIDSDDPSYPYFRFTKKKIK